MKKIRYIFFMLVIGCSNNKKPTEDISTNDNNSTDNMREDIKLFQPTTYFSDKKIEVSDETIQIVEKFINKNNQ